MSVSISDKNIAYTARTLEQQLRDIIPNFSRVFNETEDPELKTLLNDITPTLISCCFRLERLAELKERGLKNSSE